MPRIEDILISYGAAHRHQENRKTHFIGVPLVTLGLLLLLNLVFGSITPFMSPTAWFVLAAWVAYLLISPPLAAVLFLPFLVLAGLANSLSMVGLGFIGFLVSMGIGWYFQLKGHRAEGNKPALTTNLLQIFSAPLFLAAEFLFSRGWKPELARRVHGQSA